MFITFEGIDGSGKTTQAAALANFFNELGVPAWYTSEPYTSDLKELVLTPNTEISPMAEYLLFAADRVIHQEDIQGHLDNGEIVICDRYLASSLAYQGTRGVPINTMREIFHMSKFMEPDLVVWLDVAPEVAMERVNKRNEIKNHFDNDDLLTYQIRRKIYKNEARSINWVTIPQSEYESTESPNTVFHKILSELSGSNFTEMNTHIEHCFSVLGSMQGTQRLGLLYRRILENAR